jgi:hypothetical protein
MFMDSGTASPKILFLLALAALHLGCGSDSGIIEPPSHQDSGQPAMLCPSSDGSAVDGSAADGPASAIDEGPGMQRQRAIVVSLDGMGAVYVQKQLAAGKLPALAALARAGASTLNARADYDYTITLPNHTSMLTGRPVSEDSELPPDAYHGWTINGLVDFSTTIHNSGNPHLSYVYSAFDVAHDHGRSTCMYAGKVKFTLFSNSYGARYGAPDGVAEDNGRNKIDHVVILEKNSEQLVAAAEGDLASGACDFAFIHIPDLDAVGHASGWGGEEWLATLDMVDGWVGRIAKFASPDTTTAPFGLVVTADHGGNELDHSDASNPADYTIPFYVVAPDVAAGADLYALAGGRRADPGAGRPRNSAPIQPVRNGDAGNTALGLMGLPPIPGSLFRGLLAPR